MNFSKLKFDIEKQKLSKRQLSMKVGMTNTGFHRALNGGTMSIQIFEKVCMEYQLNPNDYFELDHLKPLETQGTGIDDKLTAMEKIIKDIRVDLKKEK